MLWRLAMMVTRPQTAGTYVFGCSVVGAFAALTVMARTDSVLLMPIVALILFTIPWPQAGEQSRDRKGAVSQTLRPRLLGIAIFSLFILIAYAAWTAYVWHYTHELSQGSGAVKMEWRKHLMSRQVARGRRRICPGHVG